jgi:hypothetical protein
VRGAALLLLSGVAIVSAGCASGATSSPAGLRLQREDLVAVCRALNTAERSVGREVATTRTAWRVVANGLPPDTSAIARQPIAAAIEGAAKIEVPALLQEAQVVSLTGPAAQLAGLFQSFAGLSMRGWRLIGAAIEQIEHGSPATARFARENVALYIESVYDGHFSLAQIGKKLRVGYSKLGGPAAFGDALTQGEVDALARTYSEATDRLHPHVGIRLGA